MNVKNTTPRHIIVKERNTLDRENSKSSQIEKVYRLYEGAKIRLMVDFSTEVLSLKFWEKLTGCLEFYN